MPVDFVGDVDSSEDSYNKKREWNDEGEDVGVGSWVCRVSQSMSLYFCIKYHQRQIGVDRLENDGKSVG